MKPPSSFWRYGAVGIFSNAVLYALFVLLVRAGLAPTATAGLCYLLGLAMSYVLNRRWSFESVAGHERDLPRFLFSYGVGFVAAIVFIALLVRVMPAEVAQLLNIGLTALVIYICLTLTGFGRGGHRAD